MTIRALMFGVLHGIPLQRTGPSGNPYVTAKIRADGKGGVPVWVSAIAFGEVAERLVTLNDGAALSVSGRAEVSAWSDKNGEPKAGLSLVVEELATLKAKPKARDDGHQHRRSERRPATAGAGFDDLDEWQP